MRRAYGIEGGGLRLRPLEESDIERLRIWRNDPANNRFLRRLPYITPEAQRLWLEDCRSSPDELYFAIAETKRLHTLIGSVSLYHITDGEAEFGRLLIGEARAHGCGAGLGAMRLLMSIGFEKMDLRRIYGHVYPDNAAARRVYAQAGMRETGESTNGELVVALSRADWPAAGPKTEWRERL